MIKHLLTTLLCFFTGFLLAQPVITMQDLLKIGDQVITQPCTTTTFNPGTAGANQNWNFSQLVAEGPLDTTFYISPAGTPYVANYPSSNIVSRLGDQYGYYQIATNRLFFWGQSDPSSALVLTNPAVFFQSPMTYGVAVLDTIAGSLNAGPLSGSVAGNVYLSGDGYGNLTTPGGTYTDVLRVKSVTVGVATVPFLGTITDSVYNYSWYKLGILSPVLEMIDDTQWSNGTVISQTRYVNYFKSITSATGEPAASDAPVIRAFPNPANNYVQFAGLEKPARVVVRNVAGQIVLEENIAPGAALPIGRLQAGLYVCSIFSNREAPQLVKLMVR